MKRLAVIIAAIFLVTFNASAQSESTEDLWCPAKCAPQVTLDSVRSALQSIRFSGFTIHGTPERLKVFQAILDDLEKVGLKSDLEWETRSPGQYQDIVLSAHPEILFAGSFNKSCNGKQLNPHFLYFIDVETIALRFNRCEKPVRPTTRPTWGTTQCGLLAHELIEAAQWNSGDAHTRGIKIQNKVRRALGVIPDRTLRKGVETCATASKENTDCTIVFEGTSYGYIETVHRRCENQIETMTYQECSTITRDAPGWGDCTPVSTSRSR